MKIAPFIEFPCFDEAETLRKENNLFVTSLTCKKLKNGFITVVVNWDKASHNCRMGVDGGKMFGWSDVSLTVDFPELKYRYTDSEGEKSDYDSVLGIEIGLQSLNEDGLMDGQLNYVPLFFQNLKYGVIVYFGPRDWDDSEGAEVIVNIEEKEYN